MVFFSCIEVSFRILHFLTGSTNNSHDITKYTSFRYLNRLLRFVELQSEFKLMAIVIRICVFLMLFGIADTKEWKPVTFAKGENVTVRMDGLHINGTQKLQIDFAGFISNQYVSNVMIYNPKQSEQISVNRNYTGRIERFEMDKSSLSFLLLNVKFMDSGTYTVLTMEDSVVKVETSILVARQTLAGHHGDSMNITFMCNKTNISSIKIEMMLFHINFPVAIYDVSHANCTEFGDVLKNRIETCLFNGITFSLTIRSVTWLESGTYVAWDDMNFLLDSIFVHIKDTKKTSLETSKGYATLPSTVNGPTDSSKFAKETDTKTSSLETSSAYVTIPSIVNGPNDLSTFAKENSSSLATINEHQTSSSEAMLGQDPPSSNDKPELLLVSAVVVVVVAACLAMIAFWMIRHRKVPTTETERKTTANSSGNLYKNANELIPPETTRLVLRTNDNAVNLTDFNKGQVNVRRKEENIIHRRFDCADTSTRTTRNFQIDSLAHLYDYISENHDHCWPWESNLHLSPHSTESVSEQRVEYDYVVHHSFMTLRPPAPDPIETRKSKVRGTSDHSISWCKRLNLKSASRLDPSYALTNKVRYMESNCTVSRSEPGSCYLINQLAPSSCFELECIRATGTMNSQSWLRYGVAQNWRNVESSNSTNFVPKPEILELRDKSKHRRVSQVLNYDLPRYQFDPSSMDRRHRKSQSLNDMMAIESFGGSRRRSARSFMKLDCYDSL